MDKEFHNHEEVSQQSKVPAGYKHYSGPVNGGSNNDGIKKCLLEFEVQAYSFTEAAKLLGISISTIYRLIDENGPHYKPDFPKPVLVSKRRKVFIMTELLEYLMRSKKH